MAAAWAMSDDALERMLNAWIADIAGDADWDVHLFQNDYVPVAGLVLGDLTECDYDGYVEQPLDPSAWGTPVLASSVWTSTNTDTVQFTAASSGFVSQNVYGYYITDAAGDLVDAVRFQNTRVVFPFDVLSVTALMRLANKAA